MTFIEFSLVTYRDNVVVLCNFVINIWSDAIFIHYEYDV